MNIVLFGKNTTVKSRMVCAYITKTKTLRTIEFQILKLNHSANIRGSIKENQTVSLVKPTRSNLKKCGHPFILEAAILIFCQMYQQMR